MRDQRNDNFWADVFKWFLIWNLLSLLVRGFVFVCKTILIAISQLLYLIAIGIKKLIPIAKNKFEQFMYDLEKIYSYEAKVTLKTGGNYGYTFRAMPQNKMLLDPENLDLVKWLSNNGDIVRN